MWLLHARFVWSGLIAEHCSLPLLMPDKQRATIPGFNAGLKQERLKSWDSAYPPLRGSSHIARSISEKSLILDSYPGYLLTELLHTCLHWKKKSFSVLLNILFPNSVCFWGNIFLCLTSSVSATAYPNFEWFLLPSSFMPTSQPWLLSAAETEAPPCLPLYLCHPASSFSFPSWTSLIGDTGIIRLCSKSKPHEKLTLPCAEGICVCAHKKCKLVEVSGWRASIRKKREERWNWL